MSEPSQGIGGNPSSMDYAKTTKDKKTATPIAGPNLYFYFIKLKQSSLVPGTLRIDPSNPSANRHLSHVHCSSAWQAPLFLGGSKPVETDVQVGMQQKSSCIKFNHSAGFVFWCSNLDWHSIVANLWSCYVLLRSVLGTSYIFYHILFEIFWSMRLWGLVDWNVKTRGCQAFAVVNVLIGVIDKQVNETCMQPCGFAMSKTACIRLISRLFISCVWSLGMESLFCLSCAAWVAAKESKKMTWAVKVVSGLGPCVIDFVLQKSGSHRTFAYLAFLWMSSEFEFFPFGG